MVGTVTVMLWQIARKDGKFPVCLRVGKDRKYAYEFLCYVKEAHFNNSAKQVYSYEPDSPRMNILIRRRHKELTELVEFYEGKNWPYTGKDLLAIDYEVWKKKRTKERLVVGEFLPNGFVAYITDVIIPYWKVKKNLSNAEKYKLEAQVFTEYLATRRPARADLPMDKFTPELIESYFAYLRTKKRACTKDSTLKRRLSQIMAVSTMPIRFREPLQACRL